MSGPTVSHGVVFRRGMLTGAFLGVFACSGIIIGLILWAFPAQAQVCQQVGNVVHCDNGQTFHQLWNGDVVDDWGNSWVREGNYIHHAPALDARREQFPSERFNIQPLDNQLPLFEDPYEELRDEWWSWSDD